MKGDTYKETIHDGSVSYSVVRTAPPPGEGKHTKSFKQIQRRKWCSTVARMYKRSGVLNPQALAREFVYGPLINE